MPFSAESISATRLRFFDAFLTDTAELAHVVLPTTTMLEEHDVVGAYGHSWVQLAQPVVPPAGEARSDLDIYRALAERLAAWDVASALADVAHRHDLAEHVKIRLQLVAKRHDKRSPGAGRGEVMRRLAAAHVEVHPTQARA